jgi:hypothetical protein
MNFLKGLFKEVLGLFVDDGSLAIALLVWIAAANLIARTTAIDGPAMSLLWFAGCAAILIENVLRGAR